MDMRWTFCGRKLIYRCSIASLCAWRHFGCVWGITGSLIGSNFTDRCEKSECLHMLKPHRDDPPNLHPEHNGKEKSLYSEKRIRLNLNQYGSLLPVFLSLCGCSRKWFFWSPLCALLACRLWPCSSRERFCTSRLYLGYPNRRRIWSRPPELRDQAFQTLANIWCQTLWPSKAASLQSAQGRTRPPSQCHWRQPAGECEDRLMLRKTTFGSQMALTILKSVGSSQNKEVLHVSAHIHRHTAPPSGDRQKTHLPSYSSYKPEATGHRTSIHKWWPRWVLPS